MLPEPARAEPATRAGTSGPCGTSARSARPRARTPCGADPPGTSDTRRRGRRPRTARSVGGAVSRLRRIADTGPRPARVARSVRASTTSFTFEVGTRSLHRSSRSTQDRRQAVDPLSGHGRRAEDRSSRERGERPSELLERPVLLLDEIPLVRHDDQAAAVLDHASRDPLVLADEPLGGVEQEHRDVGALDRALGAQEAVVLDTSRLRRSAEAGGVDESDRSVGPLDEGVHRVPGRPGLLEYDRTLLTYQTVEQARLADVRTADDREPGLLDLRLDLTLRLGQHSDDAIEQVAGAPAVERRDAQRLAQTEGMERQRRRPRPRSESTLFATTSTGTLARRSFRARSPSSSTGPVLRVDDQQHDVGCARRALGLPGDELLDPARAVANPPVSTSRNVRPRQVVSSSTRSRVTPGISWAIASLRAEQAVHEGGLADVLAPDDRDRRVGHGEIPRSRTRSSARAEDLGGAQIGGVEQDRVGGGHERVRPGVARVACLEGLRDDRRLLVTFTRPPTCTLPGCAWRYSLRGASGATTEPMSRPSITAPPDASRRCSARKTARTSG